MAVIPTPVRGPQDFDSAFSALDSKTHDGLLIFTDEVTDLMPIASYQTHRRLPSVCEFGYQAEYFGCLASYGPLLSELWVATAQQVDRVLKGAKPAELPVQQMTHYELVINKKTARDMGMTVPPSILIRADRLIE
jgi:putative ABC transport system substrate-binding protein